MIYSQDVDVQHFVSFNQAECWYGSPYIMQRPHRHGDIEINLVESGEIRYYFGGRTVIIPAGRMAVFWAAWPHRLIQSHADTRMYWLILPLAHYLRWEDQTSLRGALLAGNVIIEHDTHRASADAALLKQWQSDLITSAGQINKVLELELQARLMRLAAHHAPETPKWIEHAVPSNKADKIAQYIADHFTDDLRVDDIAKYVNLHPNYAMRLFRQAYQLSLLDYITEHRIAHAQHLLVTTTQHVLDIAMDSGFTSLSRFYVAFKRACGKTPKEYRAGLR